MPSNLKTLVVAIGGTGTKIAKLLTDRWGHRPPSNVSIVVIDAHTGRPEANVPSMSWSGSEQIDYQAEFSKLSQDPRSGLKDWWPDRVIPQKLVGFHDGCGAIRANGRFFVLRHADRIVKAMERGIAKLTEARQLGMDGQHEEIQWEVYVLCSLGNGTGGGCFMDVATVAKDMLLGRGFKTPVVTGVFIPGSVTRNGSMGQDQDAMENRVAASGFASLIELQYEFNRASNKTWRPDKPYRFLGWSGGRFREFLPMRGAADLDDAAQFGQPYDFAFLLDCVNRRSVLNNYHDLMEAGAEALVALIGGADTDSRLLDIKLLCQSGRRFCSFGSIALEAPTALLTTYCASKLALGALAWAGDDRKLDPMINADLLIDSLPKGAGRLDALDITLEASVDFFFDEVLNVKEGGANPARLNDVFARFETGDSQLRLAFEQLQGDEGLGALDKAQVVDKANMLRNHLLLQAKKLPDRREAQLQELWARVPVDCDCYQDLDDINDAGTRWLLEQRVSRFVEVGAFGPLVLWLNELRRQVAQSRDSIYAEEVRQHLPSRESLGASFDTAALERDIAKLKAKANSVFAMFQGSAISAKAAEVGDEAAEAFDFLLWQSKIGAVLRFYNQLDSHIGLLVAGASKACRLVADEGIRHEMEGDLARVERQLATRSGGSKVVYIGCDDVVREGLVEALERDPTTASRGMMHQLEPLMWRIYGQALGADRGQVARLVTAMGGEDEVKALGRVDADSLERGLAAELPSVVEDRIRLAVASKADLDELLVREARAKIMAWYEQYYVPGRRGLPLDQRAKDAKDALEAVVHDITDLRQQFVDYPEIEQALYRKKGGKVEGAVMNFIEARVRNLAGAAMPLWNPVVDMQQRSLIQRKVFFNFSTQAMHISQALEILEKEGLLKAQADEFFSPSRVECVSVALGARLANLARESEIQSYRLAMDGMPEAPKEEPYHSWYSAFNPHITRDYQAAGEAWLEMHDERHMVGTVLGDREGELVLGLSEFTTATHPALFGYLRRKGAHYYAERSIPIEMDDHGNSVFSDFGTGIAVDRKLGPKGIAYFTDWLEGKERGGQPGSDGAALCRDLKELLWRDLDRFIRGYWDDATGAQVAGLGVKGVVTALAERARQLSSVPGKGQEAMAQQAQGEALKILAKQLMPKGERPSFLKT